MPHAGRREPFYGREISVNPSEIRADLDLATVRAAARSVHRGAWWRAARRDGWHRAPGVARTAGILAVLSCLAAGGAVYLPGPLGVFRGGDMMVGVADRDGARTGSQGPSGTENDVMQAMKLSAALYVGSMVVAGAASAQTAVEWKVSDGGNGHWYASPVVAGGLTWEQARDFAIASGGALSSLETANERAFVFQTFSRSRVPSSFVIQGGGSSAWFGPWIGGYQLPNSPEPLGGWRWLTGEEFNPLLDYCCNNDCGGQNEDRLHLYQLGVMGWNDMRSEVICGNQPVSYLIEWSADCNGDGIVDYGQILSGELSDANANNIPDCCETGSCLIASNGSFEAGTPLNACASETVASGDALGTGWMVTAGSVQRVRASSACNTQGAPKFGDFFVDLLDAGEIRQAIATTPGKSYRLTFWLSGDCAGGPATKRVTASLGSVTQTFEHACVGSAVQAWRSCTLEFIANSAITNLSLKSLAGGPSNGPLVDGVRVEDISISCAGDVDGDGEVGGGDIGLVLLNFGPCPQ